jgi:hypothetical protein
MSNEILYIESNIAVCRSDMPQDWDPQGKNAQAEVKAVWTKRKDQLRKAAIDSVNSESPGLSIGGSSSSSSSSSSGSFGGHALANKVISALNIQQGLRPGSVTTNFGVNNFSEGVSPNSSFVVGRPRKQKKHHNKHRGSSSSSSSSSSGSGSDPSSSDSSNSEDDPEDSFNMFGWNPNLKEMKLRRHGKKEKMLVQLDDKRIVKFIGSDLDVLYAKIPPLVKKGIDERYKQAAPTAFDDYPLAPPSAWNKNDKRGYDLQKAALQIARTTSFTMKLVSESVERHDLAWYLIMTYMKDVVYEAAELGTMGSIERLRCRNPRIANVLGWSKNIPMYTAPMKEEVKTVAPNYSKR